MKQHDRSQAPELKGAAKSLSQALLSLDSEDEVLAFLDDLCTPAELEAMVDRWRVVQFLVDGRTYRDINDLTGVSVTTIGRVSRYLEGGAGGYRTALERLDIDYG